MKVMNRKSLLNRRFGSFAALLVLGLVFGSAVAQETTADRVAALKKSLASSQAALKNYQWTETQTMSYKGEVKSTEQFSCQYGPDGKVAKTEVGTPPEDSKKRGLRGHRKEKVEGEIKDYMQQAVALIKTYVPPSPDKIQACKDAGNLSVQVVEPGKKINVLLKDYNLSGDLVTIAVDITNNTLAGYDVSSYIGSASDGAVTLDVTYGALADGTIHAEKAVLDAKAKSVGVTLENTDYQPIAK